MSAVVLSPALLPSVAADGGGEDMAVTRKGRRRGRGEKRDEERRRQEEDQLSYLTMLLMALRKSLGGCRTDTGEDDPSMEISSPTDVRHVVHVTFDRFNGFLGLPVELEPEVPRPPPSASASVFGVSTESMQCSYDPRGNSVPTILLLMQRRLYERGGLLAEGIFRLNAENSQEELVREQLNFGIVPSDVDVHCLAGLIKAWFRELPSGVLDTWTPEQVMESHTEEECVQLVSLLPPTEAALLDWAINLMADVALLEHHNKMNARNIAMVFAPNMTQMVDPLTALMYAVQVMNLLKTLILRRLRERQEAILAAASVLTYPSQLFDDDDDDQSGAQMSIDHTQPSFSQDESEPALEKKKKKKKNRKTGSSSSFKLSNHSKGTGQTTTVTRKKSNSTPSIVSLINTRIERAEAWR